MSVGRGLSVIKKFLKIKQKLTLCYFNKSASKFYKHLHQTNCINTSIYLQNDTLYFKITTNWTQGVVLLFSNILKQRKQLQWCS